MPCNRKVASRCCLGGIDAPGYTEALATVLLELCCSAVVFLLKLKKVVQQGDLTFHHTHIMVL